MHRLFKSLKFRIAASIFILEAVMMMLVLGQTLSFSREHTRLQLKENEQVVLDLIADLSRSALFTTEFGELQQYVETLVKDPHIEKIVISNRDKKIVVSSSFGDVGEPVLHLFKDTEQLFWRTKIIDNMGTVAIQFSNAELIRATRKVTNLGIAIALAGMALIAIAGTAFGFLLTRKLAVVIHAAEKMADGDLEARTGFSGQDEIAVVGKSFDRMADQIQRNIADLEDKQSELVKARNELELRVEERTSELRAANEKLHQLSTIDSLTGIGNRRLFDDVLEKEFLRSRRSNLPISLLMVDIDFFKRYNDHYGHPQGDFCIAAVAQAIEQVGSYRPYDLAARYGGEEFVVLLPETDSKGAMIVADRILKKVRELQIEHRMSEVAECVTVSIGAYSCEVRCACTSYAALVDGADKQLYAAKKQGRNQVVAQTSCSDPSETNNECC